VKLPNGERAELGDKLEQYSLNSQHPKGKDKAAMFKKRLGITLANKEVLEAALLESAVRDEAIVYRTDQYGTHYDVKFSMQTETGSSLILACWIIRTGEDFPRLTNVYPVNK
jgi:hypothetical protein